MSTPDVITPAPVASSTRAAHPSSSVTPRSHQQPKFGSNSRRHTIAQPPSGSSRDSTVFTPHSQSGVIASLFPIIITPNYNTNKMTNHKSGASVSSIIIGQKLPQFFDRQASAAVAAAEREKREREQQSKEAIQMSTVNDQGTFLPPPPAEKGFLKDRFKDTDQDYFDTITRTPPERVKTFLSTAHRISPASDHMNSSGKIKRGAIPASFVRISTTTTTTTSTPVQSSQLQKALPVQPVVAVRPLPSKVAPISAVKPHTPPKSTSSFYAPPSSHTTPSFAEASLATPPSSPRTAATVPPKDVIHTTPLPVPRSRTTAVEQFPSRRNTLVHKEELSPLRTRTRAQMSFLTGDLDKPLLSDEMEDALSDLIAPSSPSTVSGGDESPSSSWSETTWSMASPPKHSTIAGSMKQAPAPAPMRRNSAVVAESKRDIRQMNAKKLREMNFGSVLGVAH
ncbi:hypothetical protein BGZ74_001813 [Mortierella antarctica]|nr:hypothetical protein BGZ74_001813 [Mortierella antarctica]